jgi:hypothetical protein
MKHQTKYLGIIYLLLSFQLLYPQVNLNKTGQSTMNFLLVGTSSKAAALGEAYASVGVGSESMFYNPAGLAGIKNEFDINLNYTQWIADINYLSGGLAWNIGDYGVVGVSLLTVDYGVINGTSLITAAEQSIYPLGYRDIGNVNNVGAYSVGLSYAKAISREFSIGGTVKIVGQNLGENTFINGTHKENDATKLSFDAGIRYLTGFKSFKFGMYIRNFASNIRRELVDEQLPLIFSLGFAMNIMEVINPELSKDNEINIAADFLHQNNYSERVNLGIEYNFLEMISLRGGYQTNRDLASWSAGAGFKTSVSGYEMEVDYSYSRFEIFNNVNRISLIFSF